jgi:hypothetical protein
MIYQRHEGQCGTRPFATAAYGHPMVGPGAVAWRFISGECRPSHCYRFGGRRRPGRASKAEPGAGSAGRRAGGAVLVIGRRIRQWLPDSAVSYFGMRDTRPPADLRQSKTRVAVDECGWAARSRWQRWWSPRLAAT